MTIKRTKHFKKSFDRRIKNNKKLKEKYIQRFELFINNRDNPVLQDHSLSGELKSIRAFSITGDVRVLYIEEGNEIVLLDIGTHNQVYK